MEARLGPVLDELDDGADGPLVILALARAPFMTHGTLRVVCRRLRTIIASRAFREWRVERGLAEYGLVVAGGMQGYRSIADCSMFTSGRWRPIAPPRRRHCGSMAGSHAMTGLCSFSLICWRSQWNVLRLLKRPHWGPRTLRDCRQACTRTRRKWRKTGHETDCSNPAWPRTSGMTDTPAGATQSVERVHRPDPKVEPHELYLN